MYYLTNINKDKTYSISDDTGKVRGHYTHEELVEARYKGTLILGTLAYNSGQNFEVKVIKVQPKSLSECFNGVIKCIEDEELQIFATYLVRLIPKYFYEVPASSSGKFHPASDLGKGGLVRHTLSVVKMLKYITSLDSTMMMLDLTKRQIDLMTIACMMHDSMKSGTQEDYDKNSTTRFEHPLLAANLVLGMRGFIYFDDLEFIARCIRTHMGQWNTSRHSKSMLPVPEDKHQWLVHLADYLASRADVSFNFGNTVYVKSDDNVVKIGKTFEKTTKEEEEVLRKAIECGVIPEKEIEKVGITRSSKECIDIWNSILNSERISERQKKYVELAKNIIKGS